MRDLETSRIGAPYTYDISSLRVKLHVLEMALISVMCYNTSVSRKKHLSALGSFEKIPYNRFEENYIHF